jgi:hypothetical protein
MRFADSRRRGRDATRRERDLLRIAGPRMSLFRASSCAIRLGGGIPERRSASDLGSPDRADCSNLDRERAHEPANPGDRERPLRRGAQAPAERRAVTPRAARDLADALSRGQAPVHDHFPGGRDERPLEFGRSIAVPGLHTGYCIQSVTKEATSSAEGPRIDKGCRECRAMTVYLKYEHRPQGKKRQGRPPQPAIACNS